MSEESLWHSITWRVILFWVVCALAGYGMGTLIAQVAILVGRAL